MYNSSKSHCVKSVQIRSFSGPYFPEFGKSPYSVQIRENTDTFHAMSHCGSIYVAVFMLFDADAFATDPQTYKRLCQISMVELLAVIVNFF